MLTEQDKQGHINAKNIHQTAEMPENNFTLYKLETIINILKKNKAPGVDELPAELVMLLDDLNRKRLLGIMSKCWTENQYQNNGNRRE